MAVFDLVGEFVTAVVVDHLGHDRHVVLGLDDFHDVVVRQPRRDVP